MVCHFLPMIHRRMLMIPSTDDDLQVAKRLLTVKSGKESAPFSFIIERFVEIKRDRATTTRLFDEWMEKNKKRVGSTSS